MKDRSLLLPALIAFSIHALLLFPDFGMTRPDLPSAIASIKVTLVAPPESALAPTTEPSPAEKPEPTVEPEQITAEPTDTPEPPAKIEPMPEPQPAPELVAEPEPVPVPEPVEIAVEPTRRDARKESEPPVDVASIETPANEAVARADSEPAGVPEVPKEASTDKLESSVQTEYTMPTVDRSPAYTYNPKPTYPRAARRAGRQGTVMLHVEVLADGHVDRIEIDKSSGYELLDDAAVEAVRRWRFVPAKRGKSSVRAWVRIPVEFNLRDRE